MATAIVPLVMEGVPLIMPLLVDAIHGVEKLFHKIPSKTGAVKKDVVTKIVNLGIDTLVTSEVIKTAPDPATVSAMIENTFQVLNAQGLVNNPSVPPASPTLSNVVNYTSATAIQSYTLTGTLIPINSLTKGPLS